MTVYTSTTFDGPSTSIGGIEARGINDTDQIVGSYADKDGRYHGYIFDADSGTYTTLDDPFGAGGTFASGINDRGLVVGSYLDADNLSGHYHGFLYNGRTYTTLDDPLGTGSTYAYGINGAGLVVGRYIDHTGTHGFIYNPNGGTYTTLDDPLATNGTQAYGINSAGLIVGTYLVSDTPHGFLYNPNGGTYTTLDDPLAAEGDPFRINGGTIAAGINGAGQIVGFYEDSNGDEHGFLYNGGIYTTLDDPEAFDTTAFGINKNGHVVGVRLDKFGDRGFLEIPGPNPPPPADTTADMILHSARLEHLGRPVRDLRHRQQRDPRGLFPRPDRDRLAVRRSRQLFRQRHHRHVVAQRHHRRVRGLRHQRQQHYQCCEPGDGWIELAARRLRRLQS
jgi:probable HAF family extracellular repeat protein